MYYNINVIAYTHFLGCPCDPTFKIMIERVEWSWSAFCFKSDIIYDEYDHDFWKCYQKIEKYIEDNHIDKNKINYPETNIFKYIKY